LCPRLHGGVEKILQKTLERRFIFRSASRDPPINSPHLAPPPLVPIDLLQTNLPSRLVFGFQPHASTATTSTHTRKEPCPHNRTREAGAEEAGAASTAAEEGGEVAMPAKGAVVRMREGTAKSRRRRISWIWESIWISRSLSSSPAAVKVSSLSAGGTFVPSPR